MNTFLVIYLFCINLLTFFFMGADKRYAIHHDFRIPENFLLGLAFMGGGLGGIVGMHYFRHKTRKLKFRLGFPVCLILNVLMICLILYYF